MGDTIENAAIKQTLLEMARRKAILEQDLPFGIGLVEDEEEASLLKSINFHDFWQPSSMNC